MVTEIKLGKLNIDFVFRHKWDAKSKSSGIWDATFKKYELGLWFRRSVIVSSRYFGNSSDDWYKNMVGNYMFGVNLLVCKFWIELNYNGK